MVCKTDKGQRARDLFKDGRETDPKNFEREIGIRKQTKTKIKRSKKKTRELIDFALNK